MIRPHKPSKKYCKRCWRKDHMVPVQINAILFGFVVALTLGLAFLFWPYRCATCHHSGLKSWIKWPNYLRSETRS